MVMVWRQRWCVRRPGTPGCVRPFALAAGSSHFAWKTVQAGRTFVIFTSSNVLSAMACPTARITACSASLNEGGNSPGFSTSTLSTMVCVVVAIGFLSWASMCAQASVFVWVVGSTLAPNHSGYIFKAEFFFHAGLNPTKINKSFLVDNQRKIVLDSLLVISAKTMCAMKFIVDKNLC